MKRSDEDNENGTDTSKDGCDNNNTNSSLTQSVTQIEDQEDEITPQEKEDIECGETKMVTNVMENKTAIETSTHTSSMEGDDDSSYDLIDDCQKQSKKDGYERDTDAEGSNQSAWSVHPDEGLPTRYEPPPDDSQNEIVAILNESLTGGLLPDPEDLLLAVQGGTNDTHYVEARDGNVGRTSDNYSEGANNNDNIYEITNVMETVHKERKRRLFVRGMGSCVLPTKHEFYVHLVMIFFFLGALSIIIGVRQFFMWEERDTSSTYPPPYSPSLGGGEGESEGVDYGKIFFISVSFVHKIHGYDLKTMDLKQIQKFESILESYANLYTESHNLLNETAPHVTTRCILNNQVLSSWERKRKHQQDEDEDETTRRRRLRIFPEGGVANSLEVDFTMEYTSDMEIKNKPYPQKFQQYVNGEDGKTELKSDLHDMGVNAEEFGVLSLKGGEPNEELSSSIATESPPSLPTTTDPNTGKHHHHPSVFEKIP